MATKPNRGQMKQWWDANIIPVLVAKKNELVAGGMTELDARRFLSIVGQQLARRIRIDV
jgi:hypothetical protein